MQIVIKHILSISLLLIGMFSFESTIKASDGIRTAYEKPFMLNTNKEIMDVITRHLFKRIADLNILIHEMWDGSSEDLVHKFVVKSTVIHNNYGFQQQSWNNEPTDNKLMAEGLVFLCGAASSFFDSMDKDFPLLVTSSQKDDIKKLRVGVLNSKNDEHKTSAGNFSVAENDELQRDRSKAERLLHSESVGLFVLGIIFPIILLGWFYLEYSRRKRLKKNISRLWAALERLESASAHISLVSGQVWTAVSKQLAAFEKYSYCFESISSTNSVNLANIEHIQLLLKDVSRTVQYGSRTVERLQTSIGEIPTSESQVREILKTVEGIAIQAKILTLNASVEAAHAGDRGLVFSLFAEELKRLFEMTTETSRATSSHTEWMMLKAREGMKLTEQTIEVLSQISEYNDEVFRLIRDIAEASLRQKEAVEHLRSVMPHIEGLTHRIDINANEAERTSRDLRSLSLRMKTYVEIIFKRFR